MLAVGAVEAAFDAKLGNMAAYDHFIEFNAAFFATDLASLYERLSSAGVPMLALGWRQADAELVSLITRVNRTQVVLEFIGYAEDAPAVVALAAGRRASPRLSPAGIAKFPGATPGFTAAWMPP